MNSAGCPTNELPSWPSSDDDPRVAAAFRRRLGYVKAFVLSLQASPRRPRILKMLQALPLDVVLLDATDASRYPSAEALLGSSALRRMEARYGRGISPGEACCSLGHVEAMSRIADDEGCEVALVLEDDAEIQDTLPTGDDVTRAPGDILVAGYSKVPRGALAIFDIKNPFVAIASMGRWSIAERFHKQTPGSVAYFITRRAAERVMAAIPDRKPYWLADDWGFYATLGLDVKHIQPPLFLENDEGVSYIENTRRQFGGARETERTNLRPLRVVLAFVRRSTIHLRLWRARMKNRVGHP